ncbi:hypothetical protein EJ06DRAFT_47473 [Trichodelitschia bisporula]|uniref:Uncharacterized protein n=1 Tax=Trichodelitschia bisporula TaxID=703511 RepID=A0A6G1HWK2_9PEZI|nr:hypothetical protein EJ06DRAFT_47473 [Trichodelitschia bisporula]
MDPDAFVCQCLALFLDITLDIGRWRLVGLRLLASSSLADGLPCQQSSNPTRYLSSQRRRASRSRCFLLSTPRRPDRSAMLRYASHVGARPSYLRPGSWNWNARHARSHGYVARKQQGAEHRTQNAGKATQTALVRRPMLAVGRVSAGRHGLGGADCVPPLPPII